YVVNTDCDCCESRFLLLMSHRILSLHIFFFTSRRRHTRFKCDWSSDVCSSDLSKGGPWEAAHLLNQARENEHDRNENADQGHARSEERRVGKECRYRGAAGDE